MADGLLIGLFIATCAAVWVYYDAKERNIDSAGTYAWATLLVLIIGLPLYLYERSKHPITVHPPGTRFCLSCGYVQTIDAPFCPYCGAAKPNLESEEEKDQRRE